MNPKIGGFRSDDPETSKAAAYSVDAIGLENIVLQAIKNGGADGRTAQEFSEDTGLALNTVSPRTAPLQRKGLIRKGPRRDGRIAWVAV